MAPINSSREINHTVLLDISLFVLDVLSPENIIENYLNDNIILEVPSAFVTMIQDARAGNPLLGRFIYSHLLAIQKNPIHQQSTNSDIRRLVLATQEELEIVRNNVLRRITRDFVPLIIGAAREINQEESTSTFERYPIQRYEPLQTLSSDELHNLRMAYLQELNISPHPLIDLYFLQIYHAQTIGVIESLVQRRELVSIGRITHEAIKRWKGGKLRRFENSTDFVNQRSENISDTRLIRQSRNLLTQIVNNYFKSRWVHIATATTSILVDLVITVPQTGGIGWGEVGLATIGFYSADLIVRGVTNPDKEPWENRIIYIFIGVILIVCVFMIFILPKTLRKPFAVLFSTPTTDPGILLPNQLTPQVAFSPTTPIENLTVFPVVIPNETLTSTENFLISTIQPGSIGYCSYVVQPGDTIQSVASRFQISEIDLRTNNKHIALGIFVVNQMVNINTSCCRPIRDNGFSYTVQHGETLYSIAKRYSINIETLVEVNNLYNPRYIQAGQMLCIPYP